MDTYRSGGGYTLCQRTGFKVRYDDTVREWTGLRVLKEHADPRHPLDRQTPKRDVMRYRAQVPEPPDEFLTTNQVTWDDL